ncbi:MAG TPA: RNA 2',3'-cyclic phosphodiesterase [Bryobacteraceae bacterium]|nr:RNA 2',3'-cyclic phosphodiesterase [Bryobacteraceae bacterium]
MRLFTAIDIAPAVRENLEALLAKLKPLARIGWTRVDNLHVTTKFIGEWPEEKLDEMKRALAAAARSGPIEIAIRGVGWFPNHRHPRVLWTGVDAGSALEALAHSTEDAAHSIGVAKEDRQYSPHLTLARIRERVSLDALQRALAPLEAHEFGAFRAEHFYLYLSQSGRYTKLTEFAL